MPPSKGSPETPYTRTPSTETPPNQQIGIPLEQEEEEVDGQQDDEDNSELGIDAHDKTTAGQVFVHLVKGYIGPGCLSLPWAISELGFVLGCSATFLLGFWTSYNCWVVVGLKRRQQQERPAHLAQRQITYPEVSGWLYGGMAQRLTVVCILVQQLAVCCVFMSFIGTNLRVVMPTFWGIELSQTFVTTLAVPAAMALSLIPNLKALAPFVGLGAVLLFSGFGLLLIVVLVEWESRPTEAIEVNWAKVPLAMCAILYSYEGINLILPLESSMKHPQKFFGVFTASMATAAICFASVASISVAAFGKVTTGSITAFLVEKYSEKGDSPHLMWLVQIANAVVSLSVLFTYPLQLFPCFELVDEWLGSDSAAQGNAHRGGFSVVPQGAVLESGIEDDEEMDREAYLQQQYQEMAPTGESSPGSPRTRILLVLSTYLAAIAIPNVESLISLAGALAGSSVALVIPPLLQLAWYKRSGDDDSGLGLVKCYILLELGVLFMGIGTVASLRDIFRHDAE